MKKLVAGLMLVGSAATAQAADMAVKAPYYKAPVATVYDWTGFYIGVNGGYGLGRNRLDISNAVAGFDTVYGQPRGGFGGGQIGYNWQTNSSFLGLGAIVYGVEADIQGSDQRDQTLLPITVGTIDQRLDYFGTVRGRIGLATGPMITYVTGGYAYGGVRTNVTTGGINALSTSQTRGGYTYGSGVEAALGGNWTGKIEYLYIDLRDRTDGLGVPLAGVNLNTQYRDQIFRVGLNYRINGNGGRVYTAAPASNWSGFYIGGNVGGATAHDRTSLAIGPFTETFNLSPDGYFGGVQGGYNWQSGNFVFGLEADYQMSSARDNRTCVFSCTAILGAAYDSRLPSFGTARGRIGYSVGSSLFYATGGYAYGRVRTDITTTVAGTPTVTTGLRADRDGYAVGGGIETPFTFLGLFGPSWTTKTEYLYVDLGRQTDTFVANAAVVTNSTRVTEHVFRTGINYHFNSPVVAKY